MSRTTIVLVGIMLGLVVGCRKTESSLATVSGQVTYLGKPLPGGWVEVVHASSGQRARGDIEPDGRFQLEAQIGVNQVAVIYREADYPDPSPNARPGTMMPGKLLIPYKYTVSSISGLTFDVQPGENTANFVLGP